MKKGYIAVCNYEVYSNKKWHWYYTTSSFSQLLPKSRIKHMIMDCIIPFNFVQYKKDQPRTKNNRSPSQEPHRTRFLNPFELKGIWPCIVTRFLLIANQNGIPFGCLYIHFLPLHISIYIAMFLFLALTQTGKRTAIRHA